MERVKHPRTFVIAECCSSWRFGDGHLANAFRMIEAAKACDSDAAKFQWCSDPVLMSQRRNDNTPSNYEILVYPIDWLHKLKAKCDEVGIEFMCTVFLEKDIPTIAPLVKRFKVASAESSVESFVNAHLDFFPKRDVIVSYAFGSRRDRLMPYPPELKALHCVCSYPTPIEQINLGRVRLFHGLSDHTTSTLTGALAVAAGATIVEKHIKLMDTPESNPDSPHSLVVDKMPEISSIVDLITMGYRPPLTQYLSNIREAEKAMGSGEHIMQECEKVNIGRRVKA